MKKMMFASVFAMSALAPAGCNPFFDQPGEGDETTGATTTTHGATTTDTTTETGGTDTGAGGGGGGEDTGLSACAIEHVSGACETEGALECDEQLVCCGGHWLIAAKVGNDCGGEGEGGGRTGGGGEGGGRPPTKGTLTIKTVLLDQTGNHKLQVRSLENWDAPVSAEGTAGEFDFEVEPGSTFKFVGFTDPGTANQKVWCQGAPTALVAAFWASSLAVEVVELPGSCAFRVKVTAIECAGDKDCDGDPDDADCGATDTLKHHGGLETFGDEADYDCDGAVDPPTWTYTATGFQPNVPVVLEDYDTGVTHLMEYVPSDNKYVASLVSGIEAPLRFLARTADGLQLSTFETEGGECSGIPLTVKSGDQPVDQSGFIPPSDPDAGCAQSISPK